MVKRIRSDADILRAARKRIALKKSDQLCYAIDRTKVGTVEQKTKLMRWIQKMLYPHCNYSVWLRDKHPDKFKELSGWGEGRLREGRLAWINWMINECEKESDNG